MRFDVNGSVRCDSLESLPVDSAGVSNALFVVTDGATVQLPLAGSVVPVGRAVLVYNSSNTSTAGVNRTIPDTINGGTPNYILARRAFALCYANAAGNWSVSILRAMDGYRSLAANGGLTLNMADSVIELSSTNTANKNATMSTFGMYTGRSIRAVVTNYSSTGSYRLAMLQGTTSVTVQLAGVGQGVDFVFDGTDWKLIQLFGGATLV